MYKKGDSVVIISQIAQFLEKSLTEAYEKGKGDKNPHGWYYNEESHQEGINKVLQSYKDELTIWAENGIVDGVTEYNKGFNRACEMLIKHLTE